jgi:hypothetical protein
MRANAQDRGGGERDGHDRNDQDQVVPAHILIVAPSPVRVNEDIPARPAAQASGELTPCIPRKGRV